MSVLDRLHQYEAGGNRFFDCILTGDETWCHYSEPESKWQLMEWHHSRSSEKKKFKMQTSGDKMMCTVFWNMKGIILLGFLEPEFTVNYIETSTKLKAWINWVRSKKRETFHLQHDNARPYASFYDKVPVG